MAYLQDYTKNQGGLFMSTGSVDGSSTSLIADISADLAGNIQSGTFRPVLHSLVGTVDDNLDFYLGDGGDTMHGPFNASVNFVFEMDRPKPSAVFALTGSGDLVISGSGAGTMTYVAEYSYQRFTGSV